MNFRNSVAARLIWAFAIVILMLGGALAFSVSRLAAFNAGVNEVTGPELKKVEVSGAWLTNIAESNRHTRNMLILDDKAKIQAEIDAFHELAVERQKFAEAMQAEVKSPEGKALLESVLEAHETLKPLEAEYIRQIQAGELKAAKDNLLEKVRPIQLTIFASIKKLLDHQDEGIHAKAENLAASYQTTKIWLATIVLFAVAFASVLVFLITRAIKDPLNHAVEVLGAMESGNYTTQVKVGSQDEIGQTLQGLERMQTALKERTERERAAALENGRIRTALDRVSIGAMLADPDGKIIYANDAMRSILASRAGEIRKQLPQFDPDRLIGGSVDAFHGIAALDRALLARLTATHTADIEFGNATLRIVANPVTSAEGTRVGTVLQWIDRTQEVSIEQEVQEVVTKALDGDLTARIRVDGKDGFFKSLAAGMNQLVENVAELVRTVVRAAGEVRVGAEEISQGNTNLSQRTEEQASSLEETASSMEQMTSTVKNNADNAAQANQLASAARVQAEKGGAVVNSAVAAMNEINTASNKISDIIGVIDEIAFQTNLLALNAAVEAARAGDQGRGFAVVASEVRNLASRSAEAAKQIKGLIQDSVGKVSEGAKLVDDSGRALADIVVGVKKVTDVMAEIAASSQEQAAGVDQVNKAVMSMDEMTQQNAALVEEAAAATQALSSQAVELTQLLSRYRVGDMAEAPPSRSTARPATTRPESVGGKERRSPARPWSGTKPTDKTAAPAATPAPKATAAAGERAWNDF